MGWYRKLAASSSQDAATFQSDVCWSAWRALRNWRKCIILTATEPKCWFLLLLLRPWWLSLRPNLNILTFPLHLLLVVRWNGTRRRRRISDKVGWTVWDSVRVINNVTCSISHDWTRSRQEDGNRRSYFQYSRQRWCGEGSAAVWLKDLYLYKRVSALTIYIVASYPLTNHGGVVTVFYMLRSPSDPSCSNQTRNGTMSPFWEWTDSATYEGTKTIREREYDYWSYSVSKTHCHHKLALGLYDIV